ncbi:MAG: sugar kinase [Pseudomonadota bacterium]
MMRPEILCLGEPLVEFVRETGTTEPLYRRGFGGDTSNAAIAAARQGASVGYITAVGTDSFGDSLMALWKAEGVDTTGVTRNPEAPTGIYFVDPDPDGRFFTYFRTGSAASLLTPKDLPLDDLRGAKVLHLSGITLAVSAGMRASAFSAIGAAASGGAAISVDTNLRLKLWPAKEARTVLTRAMAMARVAVTSLDDSTALLGLTDARAVAAAYRAMGPEIVLVTMGGAGAWVSAGDEGALIPALPATPVDSTGAGDSFAGAFLAWWLELGDAVEAARRAAIVAAGTVSGFGAVEPIPRRAEVLACRSGAA